MLLSALLRKAKIEYNGADCEISRVICDSRAAESGALFVCITGFASDGHAYAERAYALGCRAFLAEKPLDLPPDAVVVLQDNTRKALAKVSAAYYDFPAEKLKVVQKLMEQGDERAADIYDTIGAYFGYAIAYYTEFYDIKHVLIMGRVTSGKGGEILLSRAQEVLNTEFPELAKQIKLHIPDEKSRRVGQSVAAASLPKID